MDKKALIQIKNLRKTYNMGGSVVRALDGVTLSIAQGEFVAIMGPSGSGKSTLMHVLGLLDSADSGEYFLQEQEVFKLKENDLAALRAQTIGFVFQQFNLLSRTSALDNVRLPLIYLRQKKTHSAAETLLEKVGLGNRMDHYPSQLSGGQQQRAAIARSLINAPKILFADEPTGNLDSASQEEIMGIFKQLNAQGLTIVLVTHEEEVAEYASRVIRMRDGKVFLDQAGKNKSAELQILTSKENLTDASLPSVVWSYFEQSLRALLSNKVRSGLSMLGVLIGVASVIAMLALGNGAQKTLQEQLSSLGSNLLVLRPASRRAGGVMMQSDSSRFQIKDAAAIKQEIPNVLRVAPSVQGRAQVVFKNKNWNTTVMGSSVEYALIRSLKPKVGRFFTEQENRQRAKVVVVGQTIVNEIFNGENPIGEEIKINKITFKVIGILPERGSNAWRDQDDVVFVPLQTAMLRVLGKDYLDSIDVQVQSEKYLETVTEEITNLIVRRHRLPPSLQDSFEVRNMADIQKTLTETNQTMSTLLGTIAAISLFVGGIGIMNIMLVSVTERTREIGLRKALGAQRNDILIQFLIESIVVSGLGGVLGIGLGSLISILLSSLAGWPVNISGFSVLLAITFSVGSGIVFGFWPAKKASALHPIEALRYE